VNRRERRLAERLGVEWVGISPGGWVEVCLGGPGCGCGDAGGAGRKARAPSTRTTAPGAESEPVEVSWRVAG
jgi:hypothetical protein